MSILIKGMEMPKDGCKDCIFVNRKWLGDVCPLLKREVTGNVERGGFQTDCPLVPVPPHGDLIDRDALRQAMYHEAFETDSPMQKWDSGCWIRYKMFERMEEAAPTIIPAEEVYGQFTDTAGNLHWTGTHSGEHIIPAEEGER